ncbi:MAG: hypothetical protein J3R72DRAFT_454450 [Linnemannia gamsii]|nr:MAG: hypothetical protein J3R72DRAFT_454450 [Linnemannia gamsii]
MKFSVSLIVAALVASTQAQGKVSKIGYISTLKGNQEFQATMFLDGVFAAASFVEGGSSPWMKIGIHKVQLKNARMSSFEWCLDVFGDVSCIAITTPAPVCTYNPKTGKPECIMNWYENNWGEK